MLSGLSDDEVFSIQDGRPLLPNNPTLARLLYRVAQTSEKSLLKFSRHTRDVSLDQVSLQPRDFRCYVFALQGRVHEVVPIAVPPSNLGDDDHSFVLIRMAVAGENEILVVVPQSTAEDDWVTFPTRWPLQTPLDEPAACLGFFMALHDFAPDQGGRAIALRLNNGETPVFVAPAIKWFPNSNNAKFGATPTEQLLASRGVDITRLEAVRKNIIGSLGKQETSSFYEILKAAQDLTSQDLSGPKASLKDGLQKPRSIQAEAISVVGHVRKITKIVVDDPAIRNRYGIRQYFQLHMFAPLPDQQRIVIRPARSNRSGGGQTVEPIIHENRFPVTVCVAELPCEEKDLLRKRVSVEGFFFKLWNYESELTQSRSDSIRQISPLLIGLQPTVLEEPNNPLNSYIGIAATVSILGLIALIWYLRQEDRPLPPSSNPRDALPEQIQISEADGA